MAEIDYFINLVDILRYMGPGERQYIEGVHVVSAKHLWYVAIRKLEQKNVEIVCFCLQTSNLRGPPHELNLKIENFDQDQKNINCKCSCVAGLSGQCKHTVALLLHVLK